MDPTGERNLGHGLFLPTHQCSSTFAVEVAKLLAPIEVYSIGTYQICVSGTRRLDSVVLVERQAIEEVVASPQGPGGELATVAEQLAELDILELAPCVFRLCFVSCYRSVLRVTLAMRRLYRGKVCDTFGNPVSEVKTFELRHATRGSLSFASPATSAGSPATTSAAVRSAAPRRRRGCCCCGCWGVRRPQEMQTQAAAVHKSAHMSLNSYI
jgi:hypothetical protein